jgi:RNA polymerase sigma factor (sigma-70 family)
MSEKAPLSSFSDEELMKLYQQGELAAFDHLYERHSPKVYGYLKAHAGSRQYADDLLQSCFLKLHQSRHQFSPTRPFLPWMWSVLRSSVLDFYRAEFRRSEKQRTLNEQALLEPEQIEDQKSLSDILDHLPAHERSLIEWRTSEELSFHEIGSKLGVSAENARQRFSRLMKRLKSQLGNRS